MTERKLRPAVFLDRDNTIIEDPGYIANPAAVKLLPGVAEAISRLRQSEYLIIVVTNQSGLARGLVTEKQLEQVHQRLQDLLVAQGAGLDAIYYCPYLEGPEAVVEKYRRKSDLRKPSPGMLLLAAKELHVDLDASWMIGNSESDVLAGRAAGCRTILLAPEGATSSAPADFRAPEMLLAANIVLGENEAENEEASMSVSTEEITPDAAVPVATNSGGDEPAGSNSVQPTERAKPSSPNVVAAPASGGPDHANLLVSILDELKASRRARQHDDFSIAKLAAAIAQAFALCALGWGLYCWMSIASAPEGTSPATSATLSLLAAIVFELMTVAFLLAAK